MILVPCKPGFCIGARLLTSCFNKQQRSRPGQQLRACHRPKVPTWEFIPWQSRDEDATSSRLANELELTPASSLADWRDDISRRAPPARTSPAASAICHFPFPVLVRDVGGRATVSEDKSSDGPWRTRSGAGWQAEGQGLDFDFVLSLSTGRSLFVESIHDVIKQPSSLTSWPWLRGVFGAGLISTTLPNKRELQPRQRKKRYCHWRPALLHLGHFPVSPGGSKTDDPIGAGVGPSHPQERGAVQPAYRKQWAEADPPSHRAGRSVPFFFPPTLFGLLSLSGGKFPRLCLCYRATCDQHATPRVQD